MGTPRRKRPSLDRTTPLRSWPGLLMGGTGTPEASNGSPAFAATRAGLGDAVSRSVELGYKVVDEYIQQGQRAAQRLSEGKLNAETVANEVNDLGGRIARYASDFFGAWVELLELAATGSAVRRAEGNGFGAAKAPAAAPPARRASTHGVRFEVVASRPVEVALDLRAERLTGDVRAHELRSADPKKPRLTDVGITADPGKPPVLRLRVPDEQPEGAYEGLLIDGGTNRPVGSIRAVVSPPPQELARGRRRPRRAS